ncbi:MAG: hypothetical protein ABIQ52_03555 [Vicinamibacterales bacterium]
MIQRNESSPAATLAAPGQSGRLSAVSLDAPLQRRETLQRGRQLLDEALPRPRPVT